MSDFGFLEFNATAVKNKTFIDDDEVNADNIKIS